jgi:hypothetical protein
MTRFDLVVALFTPMVARLGACGGDDASSQTAGSAATDSTDTAATSTSSSDSESDTASASDPSGTGPGTTSGPTSSDSSDTSTGELPDEPNLPGFIEGVEPESHSHHSPMIDGNGNLYRLTESPSSDGNSPKMMRSSDNGETWAEVDAGNRPMASDLEGCWQLQVGTALYVSVANSDQVWFSIFNTSDAAENPDQWVVDDEVVEDLDNGGGVAQFSSLAHTSDGQTWLAHSGTMIDGRQQIEYRRRSASGSWSEGESLDDPGGSWTGPRLLTGADDVTHLFYKDHLEDALYWRTLAPSGALSGRTRIDAAGTSEERVPHTSAVYYDAAGSEVIVLAYADPQGLLRAVTITDGVPDEGELVTPDPVLEDPAVATNDGTVAHLAVDGTVVHALWTDLDTGDVLHASRPHDGTWTDADVAWSSGDGIAWWVYGNVYDRGGLRRLGFTYDVGEHRDDLGNIQYDEITLNQ